MCAEEAPQRVAIEDAPLRDGRHAAVGDVEARLLEQLQHGSGVRELDRRRTESMPGSDLVEQLCDVQEVARPAGLRVEPAAGLQDAGDRVDSSGSTRRPG